MVAPAMVAPPALVGLKVRNRFVFPTTRGNMATAGNELHIQPRPPPQPPRAPPLVCMNVLTGGLAERHVKEQIPEDGQRTPKKSRGRFCCVNASGAGLVVVWGTGPCRLLYTRLCLSLSRGQHDPVNGHQKLAMLSIYSQPPALFAGFCKKRAKERAKCDPNVAGALSDRGVEGGNCVAHRIHVDSDMSDINQLVGDPLGAAGCA